MKERKRQYKTPKVVIIETVTAGAVGGVARVQWEKMNSGVITAGVEPSYFTYGFMAGFVSLAFILAFEMNAVSWTKRVGMALLSGFFFQVLISSGHLEAQLIQQQHKTQDYIEEVAQVSIESNSPASHSRATDTLEHIALDKTISFDDRETAIEGIAEVQRASDNYDVRLKTIRSLINVGLRSDRNEEKQEVIDKLKEADYPIPSVLYDEVQTGIKEIKQTMKENNALLSY